MAQQSPYDCTLKIDDKHSTGLMLFTDENGKKMYEVSHAPMFVDQIAVGSPNYGQWNPEVELIWAQNNWTGGFGSYMATPDRYLHGTNIDARHPRGVTLGPLVTVTAQSGGTALAAVNTWNAYLEYKDGVYIMTDDLTNTKVWKWDITNNDWDEVLDAGKVPPGGLAKVGDYIVAFIRGGCHYSSTGSSGEWTEVDFNDTPIGEEYYTSGDDANGAADAANDWYAQTFTPTRTHSISGVWLKVSYSTSAPSADITVAIYATSGSKPTGSALASGVIDNADLTTTATWWRAKMTTYYEVTAGTQYAIVMHCSGASGGAIANFRYDGSSPTYTGGAYVSTIDGGTNWTIDTAKDFMFCEEDDSPIPGATTVRETLWRAYGNVVKSATDPTVYSGWSTSTEIGDAAAEIKSLLNISNVLFVGKEDGLYSFDTQTVSNLIPDYSCIKHSRNFQIMQGFHNDGYMSVGDSGLIHYTIAGEITDLSPLHFAPKVTDVGHRVEALTRDEKFLYAMLYPKAQGEEFHILAGRWQAAGWAWHPIVKIDTQNAADIGLRSMLVTTVEGNPWLWLGESGTTKWKPGYIILPKGHLTPKTDSTCTFAASGDFYTSWWDAELVDVEKSFQFLKVKCDDMTSTETVTVYFQIDDAVTSAGVDDWQEVGGTGSGSITEDGWTTLNFKEDITGKKIRFKFSLARSATTASPVLEAFALHCVLRPTVKRVFNMVAKCADNLPTRGGQSRLKSKEISDNLWDYRERSAPVTLVDIDGTPHRVIIIHLKDTFYVKETAKSAERVMELSCMKVSV